MKILANYAKYLMLFSSGWMDRMARWIDSSG